MAQVENWHQAKNELRDSIEKLFTPIKLIDDNDDPSMPAVFAIIGFGLFAASAWLWDQHWVLLIVFILLFNRFSQCLPSVCFLMTEP